jgi:2'-5' RNA ligase
VLWAGASDEGDRLPELHRRIHAAVLPFAPADDSERFSSHITLGRFKPGHHGSLEDFLERAAVWRSHQFGRWQAGEVEIIRSVLTPEGAAHSPVQVCPLAG